MLEHILVVEDDEFMRESLQMELEQAGYRVTTAENGLEAVEKARDEYFDLIVTDVRMPGIDGLQTLTAVREFQPSARSIVITGYANPEAPVTAVKMKVDDYLMKPFTSQEFLKSVRSALESSLQELRRQRMTVYLRETMLLALQQSREAEQVARRDREARLALQLGRSLGFSLARCQALQLAAWVRGLDSSHLERIPELKDVATVLSHVGEHWDGSGPQALQGQQIPIESRILALAAAQVEGSLYPEHHDPHLLAALEHQAESEGLDSLDTQGLPMLVGLAEAYLELGNLEVVEKALTQAQGLSGDKDLVVRRSRCQARLMAARGKVEEAWEAARQGSDLAQEAGLALDSARCALLMTVLAPQHRREETERRLLQARDVFALWECPKELAQCELGLAWLELTGRGSLESDGLRRCLGALGAAPEVLGSLSEPASAVIGWALSRSLLPEELNPWAVKAGRWALEVLEPLLEAEKVEVRLKVLDLLALIDLPEARALLARVHASGQQSAVVAQKSSLLSRQGPEEPQMQIYLLGRFRLAVAGTLVEDDQFPTRKVRSLFLYLASRRGQEVDEEVLIELFWPQAGPKARHSLHNSVSQVRKLLKPLLGPPSAGVIIKKRQGYTMHPDLGWVDLEEFQERCETGRRLAAQHRYQEASAELRKAEQLYRGDFLEGSYEEWTADLRFTLQTQWTGLLGMLGRYFFERGKHEVSLEYWRKILRWDSCSEDAFLGQMLCHLACDRVGEAVKVYHQAAQKLRQELNLGPPPRMAEIYLKAVAGESVPLTL